MQLKRILTVTVTAMAVVCNSQALTISPALAINQGPETKNLDAAHFSGIYGVQLLELYKQNVGDGFDTGSYSGSYSTGFSPTPDPTGGKIEYGSGSVISGFSSLYLYVKDGNQDPGWYLFDLNNGSSTWNGIEDLILQNFWGNPNGSISHIAIYGARTDQTTSVPDGGSALILMGSALASIGMLRRLIKR
jgi:hypothetical protein